MLIPKADAFRCTMTPSTVSSCLCLLCLFLVLRFPASIAAGRWHRLSKLQKYPPHTATCWAAPGWGMVPWGRAQGAPLTFLLLLLLLGGPVFVITCPNEPIVEPAGVELRSVGPSPMCGTTGTWGWLVPALTLPCQLK